MGFGGISIWQLLIILVIVVLIFGTKKIRGMGGDLGSAIKSFKKAVKEDDSAKAEAEKTDEEKAQDEANAQRAVLEADPLVTDDELRERDRQDKQNKHV